MKTLSSFSLSFSFFLCVLCGALHARDFPVPNAKISGTSEVSPGSTFAIKGTIDFTAAEAITGLPTASARVTALNGLSGGANYLPYFTGTNSLGQLYLSPFTQGLLPLSSSSAWLNAIMPSAPTTGDILQYNGTAWVKVSLSSLATGIPKITTSSGAITIAVAGTDYVAPGSVLTSGLTVPSGYLLGRATATTGAPESITIGSGLVLDPATTTLSAVGGGDVSGPGLSVDSRLALFNSTSGKLLKDASTLTAAANTITGNSSIGLTASSGAVVLTPSSGNHVIAYGLGYRYGITGPLVDGVFQSFGSTDASTAFYMQRSSPDVSGPYMSLVKTRGTLASPAAVASGDVLFDFYAGGHNGAAYKPYSSALRFYASEAWTGSVNGTRWTVELTPNGSSTRAVKMELTGSGVLTLSALASGTLTSVSGVITSSSDARLKNIDGDFTRGLADLRRLTPKLYHWRPDSGLDPINQYAGLIAQDVQAAIPEAVGSDAKGTLSLNDRPLIAALINATKELDSRVADLERQRLVLAGVVAMFLCCALLLTRGRKKCCRN